MPTASFSLSGAPAGVLPFLLTLGALAFGCSGSSSSEAAATEGNTITLGAYTTPREAYGDILPAFRAHHRAAGGADVTIRESYLGSGAQARAILGGFEADVAVAGL